MKVFNLSCSQDHRFEGWFGSEEDYGSQQSRGLLECPVCGDHAVQRMPSAPRLNLGANEGGPVQNAAATTAEPGDSVTTLQSMWLQAVRHVMSHTEDVGAQFAEEARRIHYGESPERPIRGQASRQEREELREEGIEVVPLPLPKGLNGPVQ